MGRLIELAYEKYNYLDKELTNPEWINQSYLNLVASILWKTIKSDVRAQKKTETNPKLKKNKKLIHPGKEQN